MSCFLVVLVVFGCRRGLFGTIVAVCYESDSCMHALCQEMSPTHLIDYIAAHLEQLSPGLAIVPVCVCVCLRVCVCVSHAICLLPLMRIWFFLCGLDDHRCFTRTHGAAVGVFQALGQVMTRALMHCCECQQTNKHANKETKQKQANDSCVCVALSLSLSLSLSLLTSLS